VSKLRHVKAGPKTQYGLKFEPMTTIVLQARDSNELMHLQLLMMKRGFEYVSFYDKNPDAYGEGQVETAVAAYMTKEEASDMSLLGYLPLWGAQ